MSFKRKAFGLVAALGLTFGLAAPALAVDDFADTEPVTVTITDNGEFIVEIVGANLSPLTLNAATGGTSTGDLCVKYTDTKTIRGGFFVRLDASDFTSNTLVPPLRPNAGQPYVIAASNFDITKNYNVIQGRWSSWALAPLPGGGGLGYAIGDIGSTSHGLDVDSSSGPFDGQEPAAGCGAAVNTGAINLSFHNWASETNNELDDDPTVGFGFAGAGTAGPFLSYGSIQLIKTALAVPAGQPAGIYTSQLTVTVVPPGP